MSAVQKEIHTAIQTTPSVRTDWPQQRRRRCGLADRAPIESDWMRCCAAA